MDQAAEIEMAFKDALLRNALAHLLQANGSAFVTELVETQIQRMNSPVNLNDPALGVLPPSMRNALSQNAAPNFERASASLRDVLSEVLANPRPTFSIGD